jgi:Pyruvate/2-oxoacid:ferredoxin oxidoreductase gamma subunit
MEAVIRRSVPPKTIDVNLAAFELGQSVATCVAPVEDASAV